jgi:hypothetical protein
MLTTCRSESCHCESDTVDIYIEVGKVTLKSNGDEALSDKSPLKSNGDEALKMIFLKK